MGSIRFCDSLSYWVQPPDAENRTSGGVGEVTDTIRYPDPIQLIKHDFVGSSCRTTDIVYSLPSRHIWFR
ncbi:hypothetical protein [Nitrosomonas sp. Nm34]|uniref:hypothetical protein n=1 Tax=Nitrosomonas sp. Nm34 TaxID=1881055 RepID=UPI001587AB41|nr:hypothetical protein [Nitrosomonas sp. Nm34]